MKMTDQTIVVEGNENPPTRVSHKPSSIVTNYEGCAARANLKLSSNHSTIYPKRALLQTQRYDQRRLRRSRFDYSQLILPMDYIRIQRIVHMLSQIFSTALHSML